MNVPLRVVKLGGSLLGYDELVSALQRWLAAQPPGRSVLIVGGGRLADVIRDADARFGLGEENAHWLCVRLLGVTAQWIATLLPEAEHVTEMERLREHLQAPGCSVLEVESFLREIEPHWSHEPLPHDWAVTSDSIAARVAEFLAAEELVLLKSTLPIGRTRRQAVEESYVDEHFARAARRLGRVRCADLRTPGFPECLLQ